MINLKKISKKIVAVFCVGMLFSQALPAFAVDNKSVPKTQLEPTYSSGENVVLKGGVSLAKGHQVIAISLRDSNLQQVLRMFADKAGLNIVFHNSVSGNITLDLVNVTLNDAFNMIMEMAELAYVIDGDTLLVSSAAESKRLNLTKRNFNTIPLKYLNSESAVKFLNKNIFLTGRPGLSNSEAAVANVKDNSVLIFGSQNDYEVARKIIEKIDKPREITTFKVNHVTPKEMAHLVCHALLNASEAKISSSSSNNSDDNEIVLGATDVACTLENKDSAQGQLESLDEVGMKVTYQTGLGLVKLYGGTSQQIAKVGDIIKEADKKHPQAYIEFSIVELSEDGSRSMSNNWNIYSKYFTGSIGGNGIQNADGYPINWSQKTAYLVTPSSYLDVIQKLANKSTEDTTAYSVQATAPAFMYGGIGVNTLPGLAQGPIITQSISYVVSSGKGKVLSNPKILATNGQESVIDLSSDYVSSVTNQVMQGSSTLVGATQRTYNISSDEGITIHVTPFISQDGYITMNLKPHYSVQKSQVTGTDETGNKYPAATLLQRRDLDLKNIRIKDGETLAIGGMVREYEMETVSKTPILGDIPVIGFFFRSTTKSREKGELVIMVTPHIIKDSEDLVETDNQYNL